MWCDRIQTSSPEVTQGKKITKACRMWIATQVAPFLDRGSRTCEFDSLHRYIGTVVRRAGSRRARCNIYQSVRGNIYVYLLAASVVTDQGRTRRSLKTYMHVESRPHSYLLYLPACMYTYMYTRNRRLLPLDRMPPQLHALCSRTPWIFNSSRQLIQLHPIKFSSPINSYCTKFFVLCLRCFKNHFIFFKSILIYFFFFSFFDPGYLILFKYYVNM